MNKIFFFIILIFISTACTKSNLPLTGNPSDNPPSGKKWIVTTYAGTGLRSFTNGPLLSSGFHYPFDITTDKNGILYVADFGNSSIRKISGDQVSILAGTISGFLNGPVSIAQFKEPFSIAADGNGNLYVSDESDPRIRKISSSGDVTTYAGSSIIGFADGKSDIAQFQPGNSIVADPQGNLYVADALNYRIRKISITGEVTTLAGNGTAGFKDGYGADAEFNYPSGIAIDNQGNLFVTDAFNFRIRKITPGGLVTTVAGNGQDTIVDGNISTASFSDNLNDLTVDSNGNIYVEDGPLIRKISIAGIVTTIAGTVIGFKDGDPQTAKFNLPIGITVDSNGILYVADVNNNRIRQISFQ
jgi:sugar lactone lactonase YvrE